MSAQSSNELPTGGAMQMQWLELVEHDAVEVDKVLNARRVLVRM